MSFRIDGCGTHSVNKILKYVGDYSCDNCKTVNAFYLYEMTKKITVLYVPVAKISKTYAVLCQKCKRGYIVTEQQKFQLLAGDNRVMSSFFEAEEAGEANCPQPSVASQNASQLSGNPVPSRPVENNIGNAGPSLSGFCTNCGTSVDSNGIFCGICGRKYTDEEIAAAKAAAAGKPLICNRCGNNVTEDMTFCIRCGNKLNS